MEIRKTRDGNVVELPLESWYGSRRYGQLYSQRRFLFPKAWDLALFTPEGLANARPLSDVDIRRQLQQSIGTEPLRGVAEGRGDAVIIVDDLSRPTPAFAVLPAVLEELNAAGIGDDRITVIIGVGTHRPLSRAEQRRKLGRQILDRLQVVNHNCFTRRLTTYQRPDGGPDFRINRLVGEAGLKIAISGTIPHGGAGFGGGAKAILPSVSAYDSIQYNHTTFDWEGYGVLYPERIESPGIRQDMELCARAVGLDFSINLVFTPLKEVLGVFAGDFVKAHRQACRFAQDTYRTDVPTESLDVVIANSYPMDTDIGQSHRGTWPEKYGKQTVLLAGARDGWAFHGDGGKSYRTYRKKQPSASSDVYSFQQQDQADAGCYFSPILTPEVYYARKVGRKLYNDWGQVIDALDGGGRERTVGIFPCASLQLEHVNEWA